MSHFTDIVDVSFIIEPFEYLGYSESSISIIKGDIMSKVVKVIEVLTQSNKSWEDAANNAIKEVSKSVKNIKSINIVNTSAKVEKNKIVKYRITAQISFVVN